MLHSLTVSFNAVAPLALLMLVGYAIRRLELVGQGVIDGMNKLVFRLFLPCLIFQNVYSTAGDYREMGSVMAYAATGILLVFFASYFYARKTESEDGRISVVTQGVMRSNIALYGIPLTISLFGEGYTGTVSVLLAIATLLFNALSIYVFEKHCGEQVNALQIVARIFKNPLLLTVLAAFLVRAVNFTVPAALYSTIRSLANVATPLSFLILGASFTLAGAARNRVTLARAALARLVVIPLFFVLLAIALGMRGEALLAVLIVFGAPTAVVSFAMAKEMGGDAGLAGEIVVVTSVASMFTMFVWIFALNYAGLL